MFILPYVASLEGVAPAESVYAIMQGMDCHPTSENILTQGCLALGNIGRAGEYGVRS